MFSSSGLGPGTVGFTEVNKVFSLPCSPGSNGESTVKIEWDVEEEACGGVLP